MEDKQHPDTAEIRSRLNGHGLKATPQRILVYEAMCRLGHASADNVYQHLGKERGRMTLATVYNVLESLTESGLIARRPSFSNKMYFDVETGAHLHLLHQDTGEIADLHDPALQQAIEASIRERLPEGLSFDGVEIQILCHKTDENGN
ncbi:MAG: transcriptional repressor [Bacteroidales bacterium]|nr:transcriptional repressor [Bacteroidales bacterium]